MFDSSVDEIKSRLSITEVLADYMQLKKAGTNFKAVCPFHSEKTPSFMVSPSKQIWHCFGCGLGGDIFEFVKLIENVEFGEALKILANRAGVELKKPTLEQVKTTQKKDVLYDINQKASEYFEKQLWEGSGREALTYLKNRGLTDQTIKNWQLGWAPEEFHFLENALAKEYSKEDILLAGLIIKKDPPVGGQTTYFDRFHGRIMFPIVNLHGSVVGFTGRLLHDQPNTGKYVNSPETPIYNKGREIYGLFQAKNTVRKENRLILMEGNMDVISSHQAGFTQAVASSGTALGLEQLNILKRFSENLIFAFDTDTAGAIATRRALELALNSGFDVKIVELEMAKDPDELIKKGIGLWKKAVEGAVNFVEFFFKQVFSKFDPKSVDGKREIVKELAPLIFWINEPVIKAHFVRQLCRGIDVAENTIWDIINKINQPKPSRPKETAVLKKSRKEILEDQLLGLGLYLNKFDFLSEFDLSDFSGLNRELVEVFLKQPGIKEKSLKEKYPDLAAQVDILNFVITIETGEQRLDPEVELPKTVGELRKLILKSRMERVASDLFKAEQLKDKAVVTKLSQEYILLSNQLKQYQ